MRAALFVVIALSCFSTVARADAGFGVRLGEPGHTDHYAVARGRRAGELLVSGCNSRNYSDAATTGPAVGLVIGTLGTDGRWAAYHDTDQPLADKGMLTSGCSAVAVTGAGGEVYVGGVLLDQRLVLGGRTIETRQLGAFAYLARLDRAGGTATWIEVAASRSGQWAEVTGLALSPGGDRLAVYGYFMKDVDWGYGRRIARGRDDGFLFVVDAATGEVAWSLAPKGAVGRIASVAFEASGELVVARRMNKSRRTTSLVVTRHRADGAEAWRVESRGAGRIEPWSVAVSPDGEIAVTGSLHGTARLGAYTLRSFDAAAGAFGDTDGWALRLTADGAIRWATLWDSTDTMDVRAAAWSNGALWIAAGFRGAVDLDGTTVRPLSATSNTLVAELDDAGEVVRYDVVPVTAYTDPVSFAAEGDELVLSGRLIEERAHGTSGHADPDSDTFVLRWHRGDSIPAPSPLKLPSWPR